MADDVTDFEIAEAMQNYGGGFVAALGALWFKADSENKSRIMAAFPDYWEKYRGIHVAAKQRDAVR